MRSMKISEYFSVINPTYCFYKLTPLKSTRNYDSDKILKAIASLYKSLLSRITKYNDKYFFDVPCKVSYYIYMEKGNVEFYFIIPENHKTLLLDKIGDTWKGITIEQVENIPDFNNECVKYYLTYKKEDALSLSTDKRSNVLLSSILSTIDVMEDGDRVGVFYNFIPTRQVGWLEKYDRTIEKLKSGVPIEKDKLNTVYLVKLMFNILLNIYDAALESLSLSSKSSKNQLIRDFQLIPSTLKKREERIISTQIICLSESKNEQRAKNNAISVCESFKSITGDNELLYKKYNSNFNPMSSKISSAETFKTTPNESQNFLALPGREIIEEYKIRSIDTLETQVPEELQNGKICIGTNTYKGTETKSYLTTDKDYSNLALVIIGPTRSGKTTLISNISRDTINAGECTILLDFCGNCELSKDVSASINCNTLNIDLEDFDNLQGLGYNEVNINEPDTFKRYRNAKMQTMQLITLIDSIAEDGADLSARMDRYLECAAMVVFINGGSIKQVFDCLQMVEIRADLISKIPKSQIENMGEYIDGLKELDDEKRGTKYHLISGVMDRVNKLKQNAYMELMLKKDCSGNFNLLEEIQKSQLICLRMPESMFSTEREKDTYCTYWATKIWLALQLRKRDVPTDKHIRVNIIVDELSQVPSCQEFIRSKLSQMAKFSGKMIISCHYLGQIGIIRNELKAASSSYMLLAGCDKDNFRELQEELNPYEVEDLLSLKRYHSLNLLKTHDGFARFITKLPPLIK